MDLTPGNNVADKSDTLLAAQDATTELASEECDIDAICQKLECPFTWKCDEEVNSREQGQVFDNIIDILTEKESEFSQAEHNFFREIVVHLVLSYHKSLNRQLISGAKDLYRCFTMISSKQDTIEKCNNNEYSSAEPEISQHENCAQLDENVGLGLGSTAEVKSCEAEGDVQAKFSEITIGETVESQNLEQDNAQDSLFGNLLKMDNFCEFKNDENSFDSFFNDCKLNLFGNNAEDEQKFETPPKQEIGVNDAALWNGKESKYRLLALQYVVAASLVYYCKMFGLLDDAFKIAKAIVNLFEEMNPICKATVFAVRGAILSEYGYVGNSIALQWLKEAQKLDPDYWEWNLYCGKVVGRVRRHENSPSSAPTDDEINYLKKAMEQNPNSASTLVHLANLHRSLASILYQNSIANQTNPVCGDPTVTSRLQVNWRKNSGYGMYRGQRELWRTSYVQTKSERPDTDSNLNTAKELYLKALQIEPNCPYNNARCAKGLWSMPNPFRDKERAQKAILHALFLAQDDSLVNHYAGMFYEYCRDYEKALKCYEIATQDGRFNFPAEMNNINLRLKMSTPASYSPVFKLGILLYKYNMPNNKMQILCTRGYYYYKIDGALIQAIRNFTAAIEISPESFSLLQFYPGSYFKPYRETVNIYDLLEEALDKLKKNSESGVDLIVKRAEAALLKRKDKGLCVECAE